MKTVLLIILSILLTATIVAPSVIRLIDMNNENSLVMDFNEEENQKEGKKEINEKDIFLHSLSNYFLIAQNNRQPISDFHMEVCYMHTLAIFLPPPEHFI